MPSAARAWHTTFSTFLAHEGCTTVGFERSMWTMEKNGHRIVLAAHIDDFILASSNLAFLEAFRDRLLDAFEGTKGAMTHYLGFEIQHDRIVSTTCLSQQHYAEDVLRTFGAWNSIPALTPVLILVSPRTIVIYTLIGPFTPATVASWAVSATLST
jgi:hypothetical protein